MVASTVEYARDVMARELVGSRRMLADALLTVLEWHQEAQGELGRLRHEREQAMHELEMQRQERAR